MAIEVMIAPVSTHMTLNIDRSAFDDKSFAVIRKIAEREDLSLDNALGRIMSRHPEVIMRAVADAILAEARDLARLGDPPFEDAGSPSTYMTVT